MTMKLTVEIEDDVSETAETLHILPRKDHCEVQWDRPGVTGPPAVVMEVFANEIQARIYDSVRDEPLVSVVYDAQGRAARMIVRRAPDLPMEFEDIPAVPTPDEDEADDHEDP